MDGTTQIIARAEASSRRVLLAALKDALVGRRIDSVLVGRHVLQLRAKATWAPPVQADPQLYVITPSGTDIVTTDGQDYRFASGRLHPAPIRSVPLACWTGGRDGTGYQLTAGDHSSAKVSICRITSSVAAGWASGG